MFSRIVIFCSENYDIVRCCVHYTLQWKSEYYIQNKDFESSLMACEGLAALNTEWYPQSWWRGGKNTPKTLRRGECTPLKDSKLEALIVIRGRQVLHAQHAVRTFAPVWFRPFSSSFPPSSTFIYQSTQEPNNKRPDHIAAYWSKVHSLLFVCFLTLLMLVWMICVQLVGWPTGYPPILCEY